jgi:hypothetical protein
MSKKEEGCNAIESLGALTLEEPQCWSVSPTYEYLKTTLTPVNQRQVYDLLGEEYALRKHVLYMQKKHDNFYADMELTLPGSPIYIFVPNNLVQEDAFQRLRTAISTAPTGQCSGTNCKEELSKAHQTSFQCIFLRHIHFSGFCKLRKETGDKKTAVSVHKITATVSFDAPVETAGPSSASSTPGDTDTRPTGAKGKPGAKVKPGAKAKAKATVLPPQSKVAINQHPRRPAQPSLRNPAPATDSPSRDLETVDRRLIDLLSKELDRAPLRKQLPTENMKEFARKANISLENLLDKNLMGELTSYNLTEDRKDASSFSKMEVEWIPEPDKIVEKNLFDGSLPSQLREAANLLPEEYHEKLWSFPFEVEENTGLILNIIFDTLWLATEMSGRVARR